MEPAAAEADVHDPGGVRLQKLMAAAGVGSRRACEEMITQGRVEVDGAVVTELGVRIDPARAVVRVDGVRIQLDESRVYLAFNKPAGVVTTMSDELGRPSVGDYVQGRPERLFHVGRLDADTEGLLILTNDGELTNALLHPSSEVPKVYVALVRGTVKDRTVARLREGVELDDGLARPTEVEVLESQRDRTLVQLTMTEGRKREVRRMMAEVSHPVIRLARVAFAGVELGNLGQGNWRFLTQQEIGRLHAAVEGRTGAPEAARHDRHERRRRHDARPGPDST